MTRKFFLFLAILFFVCPRFVLADYLNERQVFYVEASFDKDNRQQIEAVLKKVTPRLYFYVEEDWWDSLESQTQRKYEQQFEELGTEFHSKIYPVLTSKFGSEWRPGIDKDNRITVLYHPMKRNAGGYIREKDEYPKTRFKSSNEREMIYLNTDFLDSSLEKSILAHEFQHLINFYQKTKKLGLTEETWLNEGRSEYVPTMLGYDDDFQGSYLQRTVRTFLNHPQDSITEWQDSEADYGALNLFLHYLAEHYGSEILTVSMKIPKIGIPSINAALKQKGFRKNFAEIFTDWSIATYINDCSLGKEFCYLNPYLKNLRVTPVINLIPLRGASTLAVTDTIKPWSAHWIKFIGGEGKLRLTFIGNPENLFRVPYVLQKREGKYEIHYIQLDENQRGEIEVPDFGTKYKSLTIIPSLQSKISGFDGEEHAFSYFWSVSLEKESSSISPNVSTKEYLKIRQLLEKISELEEKLKQLRTQLLSLLENMDQSGVSCTEFSDNLYWGLRDNPEVRCLQEFLKFQGPEIYPEGLITGNFFNYTFRAVQRYQRMKDLPATGFFGPLTRAQANQDLKILNNATQK